MGAMSRLRNCGAIRVGDYKLIEYFEDGALELFNLKDDLGESKNLTASQPEKTEELHQRLKQWRKIINAPVPTEKNPAFDAAAEAAAIAGKSGAGGEKKKKRKKNGA